MEQPILVGDLVFHVLHMEKVPKVGQELNLASAFPSILPGRFHVSAVSELNWEGMAFPQLLVERVAGVLEGEEVLHMELLDMKKMVRGM
jgi:hypothetical protein